jgi:sulfur carrier protein ThiS
MNAMRGIKVQGVGFMRQYAQLDATQAGRWAGAALGDLLAGLLIPEGIAYVPLVNGERVKRSHVLADGDVIRLVPLLTGG